MEVSSGKGSQVRDGGWLAGGGAIGIPSETLTTVQPAPSDANAGGRRTSRGRATDRCPKTRSNELARRFLSFHP